MTETTPTPAPEPIDVPANDADSAEAADAIKSRFSRAIEDARANAENLRANAAEAAAAAREKAGATASEWTEQATVLATQARDKSLELARTGKDKTSEAIAVVGRAIADTAPVIDEKLGVGYGDYARSAAGALESSAEKLAAKDFADLGEDVKTFVRKSPATALGIAAVTGFLFARLFSRSGDRDA
ncbi:hypothetical protein [Novosphingobium sp. FSW06-99]|uniref:hypothetical protein n=1 Tax=Novosphingobium sp. FSW06-99 TaxID=1739113 RepID=UPI00076BF0B5|nr:hypothetical protein [Novosphingobium sp. FSW06-99]KUR77734.1 hypothetical protein AQZ49_09590 [Novosphingobium sp. FSW06-99]